MASEPWGPIGASGPPKLLRYAFPAPASVALFSFDVDRTYLLGGSSTPAIVIRDGTISATQGFLGQQVMNDVPVDVGQSEVSTLVAVGELLVVDSEQVKNRCV